MRTYRTGAVVALISAVLIFTSVYAAGNVYVAQDGDTIYIPFGAQVTVISGTPPPEVSPSPAPTPTSTPIASPTQEPSSIPTPTPTVEPTSTPTPTPILSPTPTATPIPTSPPTLPPTDTFIGPEVEGLPTSGTAWARIQSDADASAGTATLTCDQNNRTHPKVALAAALVYARTGDVAYKNKVITLVEQARSSASCVNETNGVLSMGRQLTAYIMAADYVGYRDSSFVSWVGSIRTTQVGTHGRWKKLYGGGPSWTDGGTAEDSSANWATFALASLTAADAYLRDQAGLDRDWAIWESYGVNGGGHFFATSDFKSRGAGWVCAPVTYDGGDLVPIAINLASCTDSRKEGAGVEDAARTTFPSVGNYPAETAQGYVLTAELLQKAGYPAWSVNDSQACRHAAWRQRVGNTNYSSADFHVTWVTNERCSFNQPTNGAVFGRGWGYTDWLFGG